LTASYERTTFSAAGIWGIAVKSGLGREVFRVNARLLRRGLLDKDYTELPVTSAHIVALDALPPIHRNPFDRFLIAQAWGRGDRAADRGPGGGRRVKFEFRPIFKGFKFKPEQYRKMMRNVSRILAWVLLLVFVAAFLLRRFHTIAR
jgi:hypothetical protein